MQTPAVSREGPLFWGSASVEGNNPGERSESAEKSTQVFQNVLPVLQANSERISVVEDSIVNLEDRVNRVILRLIRTDQTVHEVEDKLNALLSKVESETARLSELNDKC
jgi:hypothetical protein